MLNVDFHFIHFSTLIALGFISGKFISTSLIQISVWDRVKDLGINPPLTSTLLIYLKQTFCGWNNNLSPRCLLISLMTSLIFVTFWVIYGISNTFFFCCLYSVFGQIYLFAWLDNRDVPEIITGVFIIIGNVAVYYLDKNRLFISILILILYSIIKYFNFAYKLELFNNNYFKLSSFSIAATVWFGFSPTIICLLLSYITATLIRAQKKIKKIHYNYQLINSIMCVFFFIYSLFKFPSILQSF
jgi:hypothetical protein